MDHSPHYDWQSMDFAVDDYFRTDDHLQRHLDVEHRSPTAARLRLHALGGSVYVLSFPENISLFLIVLKEIYKSKKTCGIPITGNISHKSRLVRLRSQDDGSRISWGRAAAYLEHARHFVPTPRLRNTRAIARCLRHARLGRRGHKGLGAVTDAVLCTRGARVQTPARSG